MRMIQIEGTMILACPACGGQNLHHGPVTVYQREREDSTRGVRVDVSGQTVTVDGHVDMIDGNPSGRRDGLTITFDCETCPAVSVLKLSQNKGETWLSMPSIVQPEGGE